MKKFIVKVLLRLLNCRWLNNTPCRYQFVGNVDAFSREDIEATIQNDPAITLRQYLATADQFKACPLSRAGVTVIESDGTYSLNREFRE